MTENNYKNIIHRQNFMKIHIWNDNSYPVTFHILFRVKSVQNIINRKKPSLISQVRLVNFTNCEANVKDVGNLWSLGSHLYFRPGRLSLCPGRTGTSEYQVGISIPSTIWAQSNLIDYHSIQIQFYRLNL